MDGLVQSSGQSAQYYDNVLIMRPESGRESVVFFHLFLFLSFSVSNFCDAFHEICGVLVRILDDGDTLHYNKSFSGKKKYNIFTYLAGVELTNVWSDRI